MFGIQVADGIRVARVLRDCSVLSAKNQQPVLECYTYEPENQSKEVKFMTVPTYNIKLYPCPYWLAYNYITIIICSESVLIFTSQSEKSTVITVAYRAECCLTVYDTRP